RALFHVAQGPLPHRGGKRRLQDLGDQGLKVTVPFLLLLSLSCACGQDAQQVENVTLREALRAISREGGVNVIVLDRIADKKVEPNPEGTKLGWEEELERIADQFKADLWPLGEKTYAFAPYEPVTMDFRDANVGIIFDLINRNTAANMMVGWGVEGFVTLNVRNAPIRRVIESIAYTKKSVVIRERGSIYRISTREHEERLARHALPIETLNALGLGTSRARKAEIVSIDGAEIPASELVGRIAEASGVQISIDPRIDLPLTLEMKDTPWKDALEAIAWKIDVVVWDEGKGVVRIRRIPRISMEFVDAEIKVVLDLIAHNAEINLVISQDVQGSGSLAVRALPWRDALYSLSRKVPFHIDDQGGVFMISAMQE
ncbi:MAG: hypothetical protein O6952_04395, partial [Planctomycetota bacterium]|nr:hypothetical protein [Planctomycetota bacterium]